MSYETVSHLKKPIGEKIPVLPRKLLPLDGVPMCTKLQYDTKYPLPKCPEKDITLSREELGKSLYRTFPSKDFDLTMSPTPQLNPSGYSSLHDPHLRHYFQSAKRYKNLVRKGLVTKDGKVKTRLSEYNQYRMYLYHLWVMQVNQLNKFQASEEKKLLESLIEAHDTGDSLYKNVAEKYDRIKVEDILDEVSSKVFEEGAAATHGFSPFVKSLIHWKIYQEKLQRHFKNNYPEVKEWLREQTKHYKQYMEKKLNARKTRDKLRNRREKICGSSGLRFSEESHLPETEKLQKRDLSEQRYSRTKNLCDRTQREVQLKRKRERSKSVTKKPFPAEDLTLQNERSRFSAKKHFSADDLGPKICHSTVGIYRLPCIEYANSIPAPEFEAEEVFGAKTKQQKVSEETSEANACVGIIDSAYLREYLGGRASVSASDENDKKVGTKPKFKKSTLEQDIRINTKPSKEQSIRTVSQHKGKYSITDFSNVEAIRDIKSEKCPEDIRIENLKKRTFDTALEMEKKDSETNSVYGMTKEGYKKMSVVSPPLIDTVRKCMNGGFAGQPIQISEINEESSYSMFLDQINVKEGNEMKFPLCSTKHYPGSCEMITDDKDLFQALEITSKQKLGGKATPIEDKIYRRENVSDFCVNAMQFSVDETDIDDNVYNRKDKGSGVLDERQKSQEGKMQLPTVKISKSSNFHFGEDTKVLKYLYGLPELTEVNMNKIDQEEIYKKMKSVETEISKTNANIIRDDGRKIVLNHNGLETSNSVFKNLNENQETRDIWKMLEVSINHRKKEYKKMLGLEKSKLIIRRNEKIQKEIVHYFPEKKKINTDVSKKQYFTKESKNTIPDEYLESSSNKRVGDLSDPENFKNKIRFKNLQNDLSNLEQTGEILHQKQQKERIHLPESLAKSKFQPKTSLDQVPRKCFESEKLPKVSVEKTRKTETHVTDAESCPSDSDKMDYLINSVINDTDSFCRPSLDDNTREEMSEASYKIGQKFLINDKMKKLGFVPSKSQSSNDIYLKTKSHLDQNDKFDVEFSPFITKISPEVAKSRCIQSPMNYTGFQTSRDKETHRETVTSEELKNSYECLKHFESHSGISKQSGAIYKHPFRSSLFPSVQPTILKKERIFMFPSLKFTNGSISEKIAKGMMRQTKYSKENKIPQTKIELDKNDKHLEESEMRNKMTKNSDVNELNNVPSLKLLTKDQCIKNKTFKIDKNYFQNLLNETTIEAEAFKIKAMEYLNATTDITDEKEKPCEPVERKDESTEREQPKAQIEKEKLKDIQNYILSLFYESYPSQSNLREESQNNPKEINNNLKSLHSSDFDKRNGIEADFLEEDADNISEEDYIHVNTIATGIDEFQKNSVQLKNIDDLKRSNGSSESEHLDTETLIINRNEIAKEEISDFGFKYGGAERASKCTEGRTHNHSEMQRKQSTKHTKSSLEKNITIEKCTQNITAGTTQVKLSTAENVENTNNKRAIKENEIRSKYIPETDSNKLGLNTITKDGKDISKIRYDFEELEPDRSSGDFNYNFTNTHTKDGLKGLEEVAKEKESSNTKMSHVHYQIDFIFSKPNYRSEKKKDRGLKCKINKTHKAQPETEFKEKVQMVHSEYISQSILDLHTVSSVKDKIIAQEPIQCSTIASDSTGSLEVQNHLNLRDLIKTSDFQSLSASGNTEIVVPLHPTKFSSNFKRNSLRNLTFRDPNLSPDIIHEKRSLTVTFNDVLIRHQGAMDSETVLNGIKMNSSCDAVDLSNTQLITISLTSDITYENDLFYDQIEEGVVKSNEYHSELEYGMEMPLSYYDLAQRKPTLNSVVNFISSLPYSECIKQDDIFFHSLKTFRSLSNRKIILRTRDTIASYEIKEIAQGQLVLKSHSPIDKNNGNVAIRSLNSFDQPTLSDLSSIHHVKVNEIFSEILNENSSSQFQLCISNLLGIFLRQADAYLKCASMSFFMKSEKEIREEILSTSSDSKEILNSEIFKFNNTEETAFLSPHANYQYAKKDATNFPSSNFYGSPGMEKGSSTESKLKKSVFVDDDEVYLNQAKDREQALNTCNGEKKCHVTNSSDTDKLVHEVSCDEIAENCLELRIMSQTIVQSDEENGVGFKAHANENIINEISKEDDERHIAQKYDASKEEQDPKQKQIEEQLSQDDVSLENDKIFRHLNVSQSTRVEPPSNCSISRNWALKQEINQSEISYQNANVADDIHTNTILIGSHKTRISDVTETEFDFNHSNKININRKKETFLQKIAEPSLKQISHFEPILQKNKLEVLENVGSFSLKNCRQGRNLMKCKDIFITQDIEMLSQFRPISESSEFDRNFQAAEIENVPVGSSNKNSEHSQFETNIYKETNLEDSSSSILAENVSSSPMKSQVEMGQNLPQSSYQLRINNAQISSIVDERLQHLAAHFGSLNKDENYFSQI